jgi:hypothetical protein
MTSPPGFRAPRLPDVALLDLPPIHHCHRHRLPSAADQAGTAVRGITPKPGVSRGRWGGRVASSLGDASNVGKSVRASGTTLRKLGSCTLRSYDIWWSQ